MKELFTSELIEKAKEAKSAAELITLAKENGTEITPEEAANYFAKLNQKSGNISDEELANVAGGGCVTTAITDDTCNHWACMFCGQSWDEHPNDTHVTVDGAGFCKHRSVNVIKSCTFCKYKVMALTQELVCSYK